MDWITVLREKRKMGFPKGRSSGLQIARALLSDAPVLLLDECTSALDEKTEEQVLKQI